jgi:hypothetical protein
MLRYIDPTVKTNIAITLSPKQSLHFRLSDRNFVRI